MNNKINNDEMTAKIEDYCDKLKDLLVAKNKEYGNSFEKNLLEYKDFGIDERIIGCVRIDDKLNRIKNIIKNKDKKVQFESMEDNILDIAGYAILFYIYVKDNYGEKAIIKNLKQKLESN